MGYEPEIRSSHPKPPTRIEKLGELYDEAVERVAARQRIAHIEDQVVLNSEDRAHSWDMQVIQTYLEQTKRPERASGPTGKGVTLWLDENLLTNPKQLQIAVHSEPTSITTFT